MIPALIGFLIMRASGSGLQNGRQHDVFRLILGTGLGIGLCSECYFLGLLYEIDGLLLEALLVLVAGAAAAWRWEKPRRQPCKAPDKAAQDRRLTVLLGCAFGLLLVAEALAFGAATRRSPHGGWDAWAIWNMRARFLYRAGGQWRDAFTGILNWSHPDYPLLLPAFIARSWRLLGGESQTAPIVLACFFSFGSAGLMAASVATLRGVNQGLLAGLALAATPILYVQGAIQCADVPVAFYRIATLGAMALADRLGSPGLAMVAGAAAALDGWAKNEGLLWFGAFLLARVISARSRLLAPFLAGAAPVLWVIVLFKMRIATSSDIFGAAGRAGMMDRFLDPARYGLIAREFISHVWSFGPLLLSPFAILAVYLLLAGRRTGRQDSAILHTAMLSLLFTAIGYFLIYVLRPLDLAWLLDSSLDRLLLQLWPGIVFAVFLEARAPQRDAAYCGHEVSRG
jgi:hypothetical protein